MEWGIVALVAVIGWSIWRWARTRRRPWQDQRSQWLAAQWSPQDIAEMETRFARVEAELAPHRSALLEQRLRVLRHRGVPLRTVHAALDPGTVLLTFANGTHLIARGAQRHQLPRLHSGLRLGGVSVQGWTRGPVGLVVSLRCTPDEDAQMLILGESPPH